jgi:hypothetical protein
LAEEVEGRRGIYRGGELGVGVRVRVGAINRTVVMVTVSRVDSPSRGSS